MRPLRRTRKVTLFPISIPTFFFFFFLKISLSAKWREQWPLQVVEPDKRCFIGSISSVQQNMRRMTSILIRWGLRFQQQQQQQLQQPQQQQRQKNGSSSNKKTTTTTAASGEENEKKIWLKIQFSETSKEDGNNFSEVWVTRLGPARSNEPLTRF